jgi:CheY-like chemotaxis protein
MCTVLFISSDAGTRAHWQEALAGERHHVVALPPGMDALLTATTQLEAIVVQLEFAYDWQHFRVLGQEKHHLTAPLVVMTSWRAPDGRFRRRAFAMGGDAFVEEPCSVDTLLTVLDRLGAGEREIHVVPL